MNTLAIDYSENEDGGDGVRQICEALSIPVSGSDNSNVITKLGLYCMMDAPVYPTEILLVSNGTEYRVDWGDALPHLHQHYSDLDSFIRNIRDILLEASLVSTAVNPRLQDDIKECARHVKDKAAAFLWRKITRTEYSKRFRIISHDLSELREKCLLELRRMVEARTTEHPSWWYESVSLEPYKDALKKLIQDLLRDYPDARKKLEEYKKDLPLIWKYIETVDV